MNREEIMERTLELATIIDEAHRERAVERMREESDNQLLDRLRRLEHNASVEVRRSVDRSIEKMASAPGFTGNKPL